MILSGNEPELEEVVVEVSPSVASGLGAAITETMPRQAGLSAAVPELKPAQAGLAAVTPEISTAPAGLAAVIVELSIPSNEPPACDAGGPYEAECQGPTTTVPLDGTGSSDPDLEDVLTFAWANIDCPGGTFDDATSSTPVFTVDSVAPCPLSCTVSLNVTDDDGESDTCDATVSVADTTPPVLTVDTTPISLVDIDCSGDEEVALPTATATDVCDADPTITDDAPVTFPAGATTTVTFTATDACGNVDSESVDVTIEFGADILVTVMRHTVGSGSHPGSTKEPLVGLEVCAYDKSEGSCARTECGGISHHHYECIALGDDEGNGPCEPVNCCTTDAAGECTINLPPGDYVVIAADATGTILPDPLGVSASDLACGELMRKHLQQIIKVNGRAVPGKTTKLTGSELLIIEPEFVVWDDTTQLYPFVFETIGDWGITASVTPPEGFVSDYDELSADVDNEIEAVQFTITEEGSDLKPTQTTFRVIHKGRPMTVRSSVGIFLTPDYARARGFDVARLRSRGLIKEHPGRRPDVPPGKR